MELARITSKGQMTIPRKIRLAAQLKEGDVVSFAVENDRVVFRKLPTTQDPYLSGLHETMTEWMTAEDNEAWRDL